MTQEKEKKSRLAILLIILAILLIFFGGLMAIHTYIRCNTGLMENQDGQLSRMASSADGDIQAIMEDAQASVSSLADNKRVQKAEEYWETTADSNELDSMFLNSVFVQTELCANMLIQRGNEIIYSLDGDTDYIFKDKDAGENIRICKNLNGNLFLAVDSEETKGLRYTALLDMRRMYIQVAGSESGGDYFLIFVDNSGQVAVYMEDGQIIAKTIDEDDNSVMARGIRFVRKCQLKGENGDKLYNEKDSNETYRIFALPTSESVNDVFAIGALVNYEGLQQLMRETNIRLFIYYMLLTLGIGILAVTLIISRKKNIEAQQELETLKEKNKIMEELQEKAENLAHMQRLETIGTMTSSIAHEFNNLLTPIMGYSIMTLEKLPPEEVEMYDNLLEIYNASSKAKEIISRLSKLSRKNTDRNFVSLNPDQLINKSMSVTSPVLPKNVDVIRQLNCSNIKINGDEVQLSQLIMNLVLNAFQAMGEKGGILTLKTELIENEVVISVSDTGYGMDDETQKKIFDPFFTTKVSGEGTGLGLAIAQQSVADHNGRIEVESEVGVGTVFRIFIPQLIDEEKTQDEDFYED